MPQVDEKERERSEKRRRRKQGIFSPVCMSFTMLNFDSK
jgi:hypothetical protein